MELTIDSTMIQYIFSLGHFLVGVRIELHSHTHTLYLVDCVSSICLSQR